MTSFAEFTKQRKKEKTPGMSFGDYTRHVAGYDFEDIAPVKTTVDIAPVASTNPADKITNLMSVYGNKDFKSKSGYVSTKSEGIWEKLGSKYGMNYNDLQYEYINNQNDIRKEIERKAVSWGSDTGKTSSSYKEKALDYMTDEEVAVYNYYYQTEGKDKAQEFLDALAETLNARKAGKDFESIEGKTTREILYGTVAGAEQFEQGVKNFGNMITGKDDYIPQTSTQILTGMIREDIADDGAKILGNSLGQLGYDALSTGTNMLPSIALGGIPGTVLMGATAAGNAYQEDLNEFGDKDKARVYATTIGVFEATLQNMLGGIGRLGGTSAVISNAVSGVENGALRFALEYGGHIASEALEEGLQEVLDPIVKNAVHGTDESVDWENVAYSALLGGLMGGVFGISEVSNTHLNANENAVVDKVYKDAVAEKESDGKKLTAKEKSSIYEETVKKLEKGYIDIDTIESVLGGNTYKAYNSMVQQEEALQKEFDTLNKMKQGEMTGEQVDQRAELKTNLEKLKSNSIRTQLKNQLSLEVQEIVKNDRLSESYNEKSRRSQKFEADLTKYDIKQQEVVKRAAESGILNNTNRTHEFVDMIAKISADKGVSFDFTNNAKLKESGFALEGKTINGYVKDGNIALNIESSKALNAVVGHEITHVLEGTDLYTELQQAVKEYATTKGDYDTRLQELTKVYEGVEGVNIDQEVTADLIGDYLFTDSDFVNRLSVDKPNIFKKIYEEIKYLVKTVTGGKEARQLAKLQKTFEKAYQTSANVEDGGIKKFSMNVDRYLEAYSETQKENWKNSKKIVLYESESQLKQFVEDAKERKNPGKKLYFGKIKSEVADRIKAELSYDVKGYNCALYSDNVRKIFKDHGDETKESPRGQRVVEVEDFSRIPEVISEPEKIESGGMYNNNPVIRFTKDGITIAGVVTDGALDLYTQTMYINKKNRSLATAIDEQTSINTSETTRSTASNDSVSQNEENASGNIELTEVQQKYSTESEVQFSLSNDTTYMDNAINMNNTSHHIGVEVMEEARAVRGRIADRMNAIKDKGLVGLPEDIEGNTYIANSSYDGTEENTTICPRSLASEAFVDAVSEYLGRPLTVEEQIYISQDLQGRSLTPECTYCYVATDRKAYRSFLGEYVSQRDAVLQKLKDNPELDVSRSGNTYKEFLNGRKDTNPMYSRFKMWVDAYKNGKPMIEASHLANINKLMGDINSVFGDALKPQIVDAMKYAQSASWAKKRINYVAYNGHILKWKQDRINKLNSHYGLRMYSFSDFHPAFVLENMQMITDASVRGLKMLGYTKDTDFVEIFAPTGMNINVSTFGFDSGGSVYENNIIGASWDKAKELRSQYPNVGVTFVATNDTLVEWGMEQDWIDVVIPYHLVRTGAEVAKAFGYTNYTSESADVKTSDWKKGDAKYIAPTEHNNDKATYLKALKKNHLKPRFERFIDNPNYMKLVNECRQPASQSKPVQPVFNEDVAMKALAKLEANGYYQPIGGSVDRMYEIASEVAEDMVKQASPVKQSFSLSEAGRNEAPIRGWNVYGSDIALEEVDDAEIAPATEKLDALEAQWAKDKMERADSIVKGKTESEEIAKILDTEPKTENQRNKRKWAIFRANVFDKGTPFEDLSLKTKNRELMGKWNYTLYSESRAQRLMGKGDAENGVKSLNDIRAEVENTGLTKQFYEYMYHKHNVDRMKLEERYSTDENQIQNKPVFGYGVTAEMSQEIVDQYEFSQPKFMDYAQDVYSYLNYLRQQLVDNGVISQETADLWSEMYPHYVPIRRVDIKGENISVPLDTGRTGVNAPIKKAVGGNTDILPLFDTIAMRTMQTYKATAKNSFGVELKNTLGTTIEKGETNIDEVIDSVAAQEDLLQKGKNGRHPTFTVFENGERVTFEITEDMYDALKPLSDSSLLSKTIQPLNAASNFHRGVLTQYNPVFTLINAVKDVQDVLINSQHSAKTYLKIPEAHKQILTKGYWYNEYMSNGGEQNSYFDSDTNTFKTEDKGIAKVLNQGPLKWISEANDYIEKIPRLAEYIASREAGRSVEVSMLDAARVTTNFSAGGNLTKFLNRNGATFLNASVQGAMQQVRNVREAKANGLRGWANLATKFVIAGAPAFLLNALLWNDDEDYEELSDYVKQNYYVVWKEDDGKFIRIPKGRTVAVIQDAIQQVSNLATGNDEADLKSFLDLVITNLAPSNPVDSNILSPIAQVLKNETWYGEDLVPTRLQDLPAAEQFDESTDSISKWLGEKLDISPVKINYLIDQYSGGVGDVVLPMLTPEAESGDNTLVGNLIAPLKSKFTTDSVMNNQNVSDLYETSEELTKEAKMSGATDKDILSNKYINSIKAEMNELYKQKRKIQNSSLPDDVKYARVREIQSQIVEISKKGLKNYDGVKIDGSYAKVGDRHYMVNGKGEWEKIDAKQLEKQNKVTSGLGISAGEYWSNKEEYDYAYESPGKYGIAKSVGGYETYRTYTSVLDDIKADKDSDGKSISGSRKEKVISYIDNLDADYGAKIILFKSEYNSDDTYNDDIVEYLNGRWDITYEEEIEILKELGATVDEDGTVRW